MEAFNSLLNGVTHTGTIGLTQTATLGVSHTV